VTRTSIEVIFLIRGESGLARLLSIPIEGLNLEARLGREERGVCGSYVRVADSLDRRLSFSRRK